MSETKKYDDWVEEYRASGKNIMGQCLRVCTEMREAFPELKLKGGYSHTIFGCEIHFWLETPEGVRVDPTLAQYAGHDVHYEDANTTDEMELLQRFLIHVPVDHEVQ